MSKLFFLLLTFLEFLTAEPACNGAHRELAQRSSFQLCFDSSLKVPLWTSYRIAPSQLHGSAPRPSHFRHDSALSGPSAYDSDYRGSGFSRGHMVPAEDLAFSDSSIQDTFLLSNIAPQSLPLNLGLWRKLEEAVRRVAAHSDYVVVLAGPIFAQDAGSIGPHHVAVPTHFYKVILVAHAETKVMYAAIIPNSDELKDPLNNYVVTVETVQQRTGLDFFAELEDAEERKLETSLQLFPTPARKR